MIRTLSTSSVKLGEVCKWIELGYNSEFLIGSFAEIARNVAT